MSARPAETNPILPGFHPDPSICRVDGDYYLVSSTFEYLPGMPIHHSTDLVTWTLIGHAITRPAQMPGATAGLGIFAPTIRHRDGRFWIVTTDMNRADRGQLLLSAEDPAGPWSDPLFIAGAHGIDPDLAWDDNGDCYLTWAHFAEPAGIFQALIDLGAGRLLEEPRYLWAGTGLAATEGPHLIRRGDWWYLLVAEGGTERGHAVSIARSRAITGPFEAHPSGPLLTHRSSTHPVQNTGHADLVERPDGSWAMVYLGVRPRGTTPGFHTNGRETFLAAVRWQDDWPVVDTGAFTLDSEPHEVRFTAGDAALGPGWISPGRWAHEFVTVDPAGLVLASDVMGMVGVRATDESWNFDVDVTQGDVSLTVRVDDAHVLRVYAGQGTVEATLDLRGARAVLGSTPREGAALTLRCVATSSRGGSDRTAGPDVLEVSVLWPDGVEVPLGSIDGRYLSTEVAGGFTGRIVGIEVHQGTATVRSAVYRPLPSEPVGTHLYRTSRAAAGSGVSGAGERQVDSGASQHVHGRGRQFAVGDDGVDLVEA